MNIIVTAYPKSGSTWLCRLLGDALDCPVGALRDEGDGGAFATEGQKRPGKCKVRQAHAVPVYEGDQLAPKAHQINPEYLEDSRIILLLRDPRDVAVSAMHHWEIKSAGETVRKMGAGEWPLPWGGGWSKFVEVWLDSGLLTCVTKYEWLHAAAAEVLGEILGALELEPANDIVGVVGRQSFEARKEWARYHGEELNYGRLGQVGFLRKGIVGDWQNAFANGDEALAKDLFGRVAKRVRYDL